MVRQQRGERNFHVFYQFFTGLDTAILANFHLENDAMNYFYLRQGGTTKVCEIISFFKVKILSIIKNKRQIRQFKYNLYNIIYITGMRWFTASMKTKSFHKPAFYHF